MLEYLVERRFSTPPAKTAQFAGFLQLVERRIRADIER
jgi:hypothetical protein